MISIPKAAAFIKDNLPDPVFQFAKQVYRSVARPEKHKAELDFWRMQHLRGGGKFENGHYKVLMSGMAQGLPDDALIGKTVVDFGCGPRGSLQWLSGKSFCIGVDVLVKDYLEAFPDDLRSHNMAYVHCTESFIPLPDHSVDVVVTQNALDHVANLEAMCGELLRILKPGGYLLGSFNLDEPATATEPQTLRENDLQRLLLSNFQVASRRILPKRDGDDLYGPFFGRPAQGRETGAKVMWFSGTKIG